MIIGTIHLREFGPETLFYKSSFYANNLEGFERKEKLFES